MQFCVALLTFLRNDEEVLNDELQWASSRPTSLWTRDESPKLHDTSSFHACLNQMEVGFLNAYESKYPNGLYSLNQDPAYTCMRSHGQVPSPHYMLFDLLVYWMVGLV